MKHVMQDEYIIQKEQKNYRTSQPMRCHEHILGIFAVLVIGLLLFGGRSDNSKLDIRAEEGVIDLSGIQFDTDILALNGQWEFYWQKLIEPGEKGYNEATDYVAVPRSWNKLKPDTNTYSGDGYGTYRLTFTTAKSEKLALKIPRLRTAYRLWVNGEMIASAGTVGKTREASKPQYLTQLAAFEAKEGENEILLQVSNFHHRNGGMLESIKLGGENQILALKLKNTAMEFLLFGGLMCIGAYHLTLFFYRRRKEYAALYFGLFCLLIGIRITLGGECFLFTLFPRFSWEIAHKILTLTYYLGVPLALMFFMSIFPKYFGSKMIKASQIMGVIFLIILLVTPVKVFTTINIIYQIWSFAVILYIIGAFAVIILRNEEEWGLIGIGAFALLASSTNDILYYTPWVIDNQLGFLREWIRVGNLMPLGLFIFACTNSLIVAKRFSDALEHEEVVTEKLIAMNSNLDALVLERTKELAESNRQIEYQKYELEKRNQVLQRFSFRDPLTGIWNRRKYDTVIKNEWQRCLKEQIPITLLFLDIDCFKNYNDLYGHMAGDRCLVKVSHALERAVKRVNGTLVRYGGEEFAVLISGMPEAKSVWAADMLCKEVEELDIAHAASPVCNCVTVSIGGVTMIPQESISYRDLFKMADDALYTAKSVGRNQVVFYEKNSIA